MAAAAPPVHRLHESRVATCSTTPTTSWVISSAAMLHYYTLVARLIKLAGESGITVVAVPAIPYAPRNRFNAHCIPKERRHNSTPSTPPSRQIVQWGSAYDVWDVAADPTTGTIFVTTCYDGQASPWNGQTCQDALVCGEWVGMFLEFTAEIALEPVKSSRFRGFKRKPQALCCLGRL